MNVGLMDAILRLVIGWILIHFEPILRVEMSSILKWILLIIGVILVITAVTRYCVLYTLFGISTLK